MIKFKAAIHAALLASSPALFAHPPQICPWKERKQERFKPLQSEKFSQKASYDQILDLLEKIETDAFDENIGEAELNEINLLLAFLAQEGLLPNEEHERLFLENDIADLFQSDSTLYDFAFSLGAHSENIFLSLSESGDIHLCKNWFSKSWKRTKKFVKKHKKKILIGAAIVVAAAVIIIAATATPAAAAGAAAPEKVPPEIDDLITTFKEDLAQERFFSEVQNPEKVSWEETGRALGSTFAHSSLELTANDPLSGHTQADFAFSTNYATLHPSEQYSDNRSLYYYARGEGALSSGYLDQAVHDFSQTIKGDPANPLPYLERGIAHFGLGQYDKSIEDYRTYTDHAPATAFSTSEFSAGFAKGLPRGIYDSGEGLLLFLSDLITHPINTGEQIWESFSQLSQLARSGEWKTLAEALSPEACQLIQEWDNFPPFQRGELAGYAFGKHGSDILFPGAIAKAATQGIKGAKTLSTLSRQFITAEKTLLLESIAGVGDSALACDLIQSTQKTLALGEELGFNTQNMARLKQAGTLETTISSRLEATLQTQALRESYELFSRAQEFLKPYTKTYMSESEARTLIQQAGIPTFPRPNGVPDNFRMRISDKGAGMIYFHPTHSHTSIRIMPGKPHSSLPYQQQPYVICRKNGKTIDKYGNSVSSSSPEAHIPLEEFAFKE